MKASDALEMLGELSDGYGPEAEHAYDVLREMLEATEEMVKASVNKDLECAEFERLKKSLEGKPL